MKDSASYPIWFGRAWVFVHELTETNPGVPPSSEALHSFAEVMIQQMFVDEEAAGAHVVFGTTGM